LTPRLLPAMRPDDRYYRLAPGVDVVPLQDGNVLVRSDSVAVRLEGDSASFFTQSVFPLLDGRRSLIDVAAALGVVSVDDLQTHFDRLVGQGVLHRSDRAWAEGADPRFGSMFAMFEDLGVEPLETRNRLRQLSVAVVGLEGHGAHLALNLSYLGLGKLVLVDPYPCQPGNIGLMPFVREEATGKARHDAVREALPSPKDTEVLTRGADSLTREDIQTVARDVHVVVGCFDKAFSATNVWINEATLDRGIAALYAEVRGHTATLGPLVFPGQTGCYLCWRMRSLATEDDFEGAMTYEEFMDRRRRPALHERSILPFLTSYAGSLLASHVLTSMLEVSIPALAGKVFEFNGLTLKSELHTVLQKADCPACGKKKDLSPLLPLTV
jgi:bacteriocin biosynthesis cyclodehydratase domain-containing protein